MRKRPLLFVACVFLIGIAYGRYEQVELCIGFLLLIGWECIHIGKLKNRIKTAVRSGILLAAFILGMFKVGMEETFRNTYLSKIEDGQSTILWGEIEKIEQREYGIRLLVSDVYISLNGEIVPCNKVQVYTTSNHFQVGEIHKITGKINRFEAPRNQGNFDSCLFYQSQKIEFAFDMEDAQCLGCESNEIRELLLYLKSSMLQVYQDTLPPRTAGFYSGMILGEKTGIQEDLKTLFMQGGILHILAVSGLHMSIVGRGAYAFLRKRGMGFLGAALFGGTLLWMYSYMTGNGMSALRALGMMMIFFLGQIWGKSYDMLNALGGIGILLLWENPFLIEYSGFWFSVTALLGVGILAPEFSYKERRLSWLWGGIGISLFTLPVTAFFNYEIPLYSPLINGIVLPVLTPFFVLALLGGMVGIFLPDVAAVMLVPCDWCLCFFEWVCERGNQLPGALIITGKPQGWQMVMYYMLLFFLIWRLKKWRKRKEG